jgi:hypothetical protein
VDDGTSIMSARDVWRETAQTVCVCVLQNGVLARIFGLKQEERTGERRKLLNENFRGLYKWDKQTREVLVNDQLDAQFFFLYVYYNSLNVSSNLVLIIRRISCINITKTSKHWHLCSYVG